MIALLACAAVVLLAAVLLVALRERRLRGNARLLGEILDLADALERELLEARARLREMAAAGTLPQGATAAEPQVHAALRDLLAHRLWLRDRAAGAATGELHAARDALLATRAALVAQLARLADARADLERSRERPR